MTGINSEANLVGCKKLACHVVKGAIDDFIFNYKYDPTGSAAIECYDFIVGKSDSGLFWLDAAGINPLDAKGLAETYSKLFSVCKKEKEAAKKRSTYKYRKGA